MSSNREKVNNGTNDTGDYTLESILAEYKSSAYILGEKKLSKNELEKQAERILKEMIGDPEEPKSENADNIQEAANESSDTKEIKSKQKELNNKPSVPQEHAPLVNKKSDNEIKKGILGRIIYSQSNEKTDSKKSTDREPEVKSVNKSKPKKGEVVKAAKKEDAERVKKSDYKAAKEFEKNKKLAARHEARQRMILESQKKREEIEASYLALSEEEQEFFGVGKYARSTAVTELIPDVNEVIEKEAERRRAREERRRIKESPEPAVESDTKHDESELSLEDALKLYGSGIISIKRRTWIAFLVCMVMAYFAFAVEFNLLMPTIFLKIEYISIYFLASLLLILFLGIEVFVTGLSDIFKARTGAESLVTIASLAAIFDALFIIISKDSSRGIPFCVIPAFSMTFTMWGYRLGKTAFRKTLKTISASSLPVVVSAEWEKIDEGIVLTKKYGTIKGFISKSTESDYAERVYSKMAPLLIVGSIVFSLLSSVFKGQSQNFIHSFSAMTAVSASFSALLSFNLPYNSIVKRLSGSGAAIAGWSGACDIEDAIGMVVKDSDLFPEKTLSFGGVKVYSGDSDEKVVSYAGSMILASGSGLTRIFADLLKEYACSIYRVDEFSCYEGGGIGANIKGDRVFVGSAAFMNLMGIRLNSNLNIKNAVFISINNILAGVFIINYSPAEAVKNALLALVRSKITPLFAVRDFNITPSMVKNKFQIPTDDIEFPTFEARYSLSSDSDDPGIKPSAIMSREGLGHFVEIVRGGKQLTSTVKKAVVLSVFGSLIGLLLMFFICWNGAFLSGSPANALTFMLFWLLPVLLINGVGVRY